MSCLRFKTQIKVCKTNYSFNDFKQKRRHLTVKKVSVLLRGITSKHDGNFYCFNCLHLFTTNSKVESRRKVFENKDFCGDRMPSEEYMISEFN